MHANPVQIQYICAVPFICFHIFGLQSPCVHAVIIGFSYAYQSVMIWESIIDDVIFTCVFVAFVAGSGLFFLFKLQPVIPFVCELKTICGKPTITNNNDKRVTMAFALQTINDKERVHQSRHTHTQPYWWGSKMPLIIENYTHLLLK